MKLIGMIADHTTPKWTVGEVCFTVTATDYKKGGCMTVILEKENNDISESDRTADGEQPSRELLRTGCIQRYVDNR